MDKLLFRKKHNKTEKGMILVSVMVVIAILTIVGLALLSQASSQYSYTNNSTYSVNALYTAEAGVEQTVQQLNINNNFSGYTTPQVFFNNAHQGKGVFTTIVTTAPNNVKTITSQASVYRFNVLTAPVSRRAVRVTAVGTASPGYSVESGPGGLILGGGATITNSQVMINGTLTLQGRSQIGTYNQPVTVGVANDVCPPGSTPGSTYPQVCTSSQPISLAESTNIYGSVCATGQTSTGPNNNIQGGNGGLGLEPNCTSPVLSMPTYNRSAQISAVTTTASGTSNNYICDSYPFNRTWPNNLELTGNVNVNSSCHIDVAGNVYITGNLNIGGASSMVVDNSLGTTTPVIMVDGTITVNGSAQLIANSSGTGIKFISFDSNASCGPNCTSLSGNALKSTSTFSTININGAVHLPGMIFDAYWGQINVAGSGNVGSVMGQTINLDGAGTISFGTTLSSGTQTWNITSYQQIPAGNP